MSEQPTSATTASPHAPPPGPPPADAASWPVRLRTALGDIKLAHSVFAMPFAVLGATIAIAHERPTPREAAIIIALILAAMVAARTWAMLVNRLADRRFDADNPRTARRALASGRLAPAEAWAIAAAAALVFVAVCAAFYLALGNLWPLALSLPVLAWIALYSYTKRFTATAHFFLGSALAISPICAALAAGPSVFGFYPSIAPAPSVATIQSDSGVLSFLPAGWFGALGWHDSSNALLFLSGFVALWVAGFDIAYALQDLAFDRQRGLRSIPARLGMRASLWISRLTHAAAFACLVAVALLEPRFDALFASAVVAVAALLVFEHVVLARRGLAGLPLAFFTVNGVVACLLGAAGVIDVIL